jgi:vanillate O-demethylase monooxygenase subunit
MFPFDDDQFAPRNRWYIAAWSDEVSRDPIERWIMDECVALYRTQDGNPVALDGLCPHHAFPLGKSKVKGDDIVCGYHGLRFGPDGNARSAPFVEKVPTACRIKSYPVKEVWKWIWIWPGDPALADESLIPDHFEVGLTDPSLRSVRGLRMELEARYQLINDNLLDLQHVEVLHEGLLGDEGLGRVEEVREAGPDWVNSSRYVKNCDLPGGFAKLFGPRKVDREMSMRWHVPGLHVGPDKFMVPEGEPNAGELVMMLIAFHAVTPARETTCHYFSTFARSFELENEGLDQIMLDGWAEVAAQDKFAAEQIEEKIRAKNGDVQEMLFKSDAHLVAGRRVMERLMDQERSSVSGRASGKVASA